jgi:16S rRNA (cytosine1402-N4)-methyltransferase
MSAHIPVLLNEVINALNIKSDGVYIDCTFGAGGYTKAILNNNDCRVIAIDQDPSTKIFADEIHKLYGDSFIYINDNFRNIQSACQKYIPVDGIVYDLGVSSMQLDQKDRGFSFQANAKLDMRMNKSGKSAYEIINESEEAELADIIYYYGEEHAARQIAKRIIEARKISSIETTFDLANIVRSVCGKRGKIDASTKTFQAIRIAVNDELVALEDSLSQIKDTLKIGGRAVIVSFHALEDRIVKKFFVDNSEVRIARSKYAVKEVVRGKPFELITRKSIKPSRDEILSNPRSRSARMRVIERVC